MGIFGLTNLADRIRSGARAHATERSNASPTSPLPETPHQYVRKNKSKRTPPRSRSDPDALDEKSKHVLALDGSTPSRSNSQAPGSGDPPSLEERHPPDKQPKPPIPTRMKNGCIRFYRHSKVAILRSWMNILLVFVPIGIAAEFAHLRPEIVFAMNAIAIIPLAGLLTHATESVASRLGDTLGALLNVSFGNAVELIIL
jgi:Ca2+:H+ antiporter